MTAPSRPPQSAPAGPVLSLARKVPAPRPATFAAMPAPVELDLAQTALVVVDMQNDFLHPDGWFPQAGVDAAPLTAIIPQVRALADAARAAAVPVIWVNWGVRADRAELPDPVLLKAAAGGTRPVYADPSPSGRGRIVVAGEWGAQVVDELGARPDDLLVYKHRLSGFFDSELDSVLRNRGIHTLVFAGINIDRCVFSTLCDAAFLGYGVVLAEDATATPSPDFVREAILYLVRLLYGATCRSADLMAVLTKKEPA
ncbi:isochorismatase family protein [Xanthobacter dioxanivorans]|uniref:Isochorismatase family protein n=1 Tax=Xanthobacter dioxanivorans TaxID=2528964 RepID=A0A974PN29_9HYPH|nr:cysteine hydrolase family protein [Xanthobacter dioxanivorans]QRG06570.1 isochorismatase family protein [Xanthobacter dioxanivorans]